MTFWGRFVRKQISSGIRPTQLIHLTRLWLVVEGEHDAMASRHFFGAQLQRHPHLTVPASWCANALSIGQLEHLASYRSPIDAIFDTAIAASINTGETDRAPTSVERRIITTMTRLADDAGVDLQIHELEATRHHLRAAGRCHSAHHGHRQPAPDNSVPGMAGPVGRPRRRRGVNQRQEKQPPNLKQFVLRRLGLKMDADAFVEAALEHASHPLPADSKLAQIIERIVTRASSD